MSARERAAWAAKINDAWRKSVEGILKCARYLRDAQIKLGDAEFLEMVEHELVVGRRTVQRLLVIAADRRLATHVSLLPPSWGTLHVLAHVPDEAFNEAVANGRIHPAMTRAEAEQLVPRPEPRPRSETVAVQVTRLPDETEPPTRAFVTVAEPEEAYHPDQTPPAEPEHQRERVVADALVELAALVDGCDVEALAALMRRDDPTQIEKLLRVARFVERLKLAVGGSASGALH